MKVGTVIGLACATLFVLVHRPMWLGEAFPGWDITRVFWADLAFARYAVVQGELPVWNPYDRAGYPFLAEPQSGMFDPVTWALITLAVVLGSAPAWLIVLKAMLHLAIGAAGVATYLRHRNLPPWAYTLGAVLFVLCPRIDKLKDQSALWPTVWIGWLLLVIDRVLDRPSPWRGAGLGVVAGLTVTSGYPPGAFRLFLLAIPYAVVVLLEQLRRRTDRRAYVRSLAIAGGVAALVWTGLCTGQIWSTLGALEDTTRASIGAGAILASHTEPNHLWGMFAPSTAAVTPLLVYVGVAGAAGIVAVVTRPRAVPTVLLTVGLLGFALACGDKLPLLPALVELPGFGAFRIAGHYLTLFAVGGILAGVMGLAALTQAQGRSRWRVLAVVLLVLAGFTIAADDPRPMTVLILALGTGLVVGLAWAPPVWRPRIGWMLVGLTVVDLFFAGRRVAEILQPLPQAEPGRILAGYADPHGHTRVADFEWAGHRIGPREGVRDLIGHRPALTDERYMMMYRAAPHSVELLRAMNVGVVGFSRFARATRTGKLDPIAGHERLYRVPDPWPMAWWTDDIVVVETPAEALASLRRHQQPIAVFESADLPPGVTAARGPEPPARPRVVELGLSRLVFEIDVPASGVFVISEAYADGWTAWVDGSPVTIHRANMIARALPMSPGAHRVELEYAPAGVRSSWWLWLATWATLLVVASFRRRYASRVRATP